MFGGTSGILMGVLDPILGKLSALLEDNYHNISNNREDISFLLDELSSMKTGLETMSDQESANAQGSEWMSQMRELAYDVEDLIDTFMLQPSRVGSNDGFMKSVINKLRNLMAQSQFANEIRTLKKRALDVSDRRKRYRMDPSAFPKDMSIDPRLPALFEEPGRIIGLEKQLDELVAWINNTDCFHQKCSVLSIAGFGGLGKTTLANQVFNKVKSQFESTAFVSASRTPNIPSMLRLILMQIRKASQQVNIGDRLEDRDLGYAQTIKAIREFLETKRFLIVIDDVWSKQAWHLIQCAFPQNNKACILITTTRIEDVARFCSSQVWDKVHHMDSLDEVNSRALFYIRVFPNAKCPVALEEISHNILKKCHGLPLAIVNIGSLLASKAPSKEVWERVLNSLGASIKQHHELQMVQRILFLSYYDLPSHLKLCFLDLSTFPEDFEIDTTRLKRRWIAEGSVAEQRGQCLEDTAQDYVNELINRNMVQPGYIDYKGKAVDCRVHDMLLDLTVSLSEQENFSTIVDGRELRPLPNKIRRLSLQANIEEHTPWKGKKDLSHVRSLSVFGGVKNLPPLLNFHCLRVLDMENCSDLEMAYIQNIGRLTQLRFICLRGANIIKIPADIGQLKLLRTLDLRATRIEDLPVSVAQLENLVCLWVPQTTRFPSVIEKMGSVEELSVFNTGINSTEIVQQLGSLTKLKVLRFMWCADDTLDGNFKESCVSSLRKLGDLQVLEIECMEWCSLDFLDSWCPPPSNMQSLVINCVVPFFTRLPQWINLSELTTLQIFVKKLGMEDMQILEALPVLMYLNIDAAEPMKETHTVSRTGFQNLKVFYFCLMILFGVSVLRFEAGAAPRLEMLSLTFDAKRMISLYGAGFNCGISHLSCLKEVSIHINSQGASSGEVEAAEAAIRNEAAFLPSCLTPRIMTRSM